MDERIEELNAVGALPADSRRPCARDTDLTEPEWRLVQAILLERPEGPRCRGCHGRWRLVNRSLVNGIFWKLRTGCEWRMVPPRYGKWNSIYQCYRRWERSGVWAKVGEALGFRATTRGPRRMMEEQDQRSIR